MILSVFTTSIYKNKINSNGVRLINELNEDIENLLASDEAGHNWSEKNYEHGYTSYGSQDRLHLVFPSFKKLETALNKHVEHFLKQLELECSLKNDLHLTHSWVNVMPVGAKHTAHIHPLSVISGTFYVQVPQKASSIKFEDPRLGFFMNAPAVKPMASLANQRFVEISPKAGDVVLFESWLRHEVPANTTKLPRISISFNYGWKKS